ncbi:phage shock protein E [Bathymodiolus japonicus methanotrophic gill symbiont]|uniref:rhodanese-like domain-containing protein n=1 Tax=Bathymodiolus japonicus methanotrophic gill symbiont TaxID=113269 RepID=UPI001B7AD9EC|nr:rhodanese-like domain-containing protein [Bathymodiolus japonicus methanotrophic gill symbiont]GFO71755.1 phage shock protein E [Bathymodiolus japonicus methanotrophic gill symbiont]
MKVFILSLLSIFLQACSTSSDTHIKQAELLSILNSEQNHPIIIDVRSSVEYNAGHIPQAQHISFWQSFTTDALNNKDKQEAIFLYCEHGPRAGIAKLAYSMAGFKNIRYVQGHMTAWRRAGLPMETK